MEQKLSDKSLWYVVNVYASCEKKVAQTILEQAQKKGLNDFFEEVLVPSEDVVEIKKGNKKTVERNFFPGYVLVKMVLNEHTWRLVREIPRVSNFLGNGGKPSPISSSEVKRIMSQVQEAVEKPKSHVSFEVGEQVKVCDGAFATFMGFVEEVDNEKNRLKISVTIFGRSVPVDLEFSQVEKQ